MTELRKRSFVAGVIIGVLLLSAVMAIGIAITVRIPVALNEPPVTYLEVDANIPPAVCAGDVLAIKALVHINQPGLLQTYTSIREADTGRSVPGTQGEIGARLHPTPAQFSTVFTFTTPPNLPPGDYQHVRATVALNMDSQPTFLVIPFTVLECAP